MSMRIDLTKNGIPEARIAARREEAQQALGKLWDGGMPFTGWVKLPREISEKTIQEIENAAEEIRKSSDYFLVLGVGGSFMGAKAVIDLIGEQLAGVKVRFAGYNFSARYLRSLLAEIEGHDVSLCVISKSGSTTETLSAFGIFREYLIEKYGAAEAARRTYYITEHRSNYLFDLAEKEHSRVFDLALDIGGRYSVLTPVGLLPVAAAGIDIRALIVGAKKLADPARFAGSGLDYAVTRQEMYDAGKRIEVFEFFDPYAAYFGEWLKQLFGESEGKDGKGLFPASLMFSRDLHSMGQYLQQGTQDFFETFVTAEEDDGDVPVPESAKKPFAGKTIGQINHCAEKGVFDAHVKAGIPVLWLRVDRFSAETVGELLYWFETQCAVSALLSGVDPFNQPGVEAYKKEMRGYLEKL